MANLDPPRPPPKLGGCAFILGLLFFIVLSLLAIISTLLAQATNALSTSDTMWFTRISAVLWPVWFVSLLLLITASRRARKRL